MAVAPFILSPPPTVEALRALRKGQSLTFFRGDFPSLHPPAHENESPLHDSVLRTVFAEARRLERAGIILLGEYLIEIPLPQWKHKLANGKDGPKFCVVTCHTAIGLKANSDHEVEEPLLEAA